jgi:hypothetical protein
MRLPTMADALDTVASMPRSMQCRVPASQQEWEKTLS